MRRYILSPQAQADLEDIWDYTAAKWGMDQAENYTREIKTVLEQLAKGLRKGRLCEDVRAGYSKSSFGSHVVFYRTVNLGIDVVRILHQRMDFIRHLQ